MTSSINNRFIMLLGTTVSAQVEHPNNKLQQISTTSTVSVILQNQKLQINDSYLPNKVMNPVTDLPFSGIRKNREPMTIVAYDVALSVSPLCLIITGR